MTTRRIWSVALAATTLTIVGSAAWSSRYDHLAQELHKAVMSGKLAAVERLLSAGADVNAPYRSSLLHPSLLERVAGWLGPKRFFCGHYVSYERARDGSPVLVRASDCGNVEMVKLLLARGARADAAGPSGETALLAAAYRCRDLEDGEKYEEITRVLLRAGAQVNSRTWSGDTAVAIATRMENHALATMLRKVGGRP